MQNAVEAMSAQDNNRHDMSVDLIHMRAMSYISHTDTITIIIIIINNEHRLGSSQNPLYQPYR